MPIGIQSVFFIGQTDMISEYQEKKASDHSVGLKPFLITGAHRTGTTWLGTMLSASPWLLYISEPFHPNSANVSSPHASKISRFYTYVCQENQDEYQQDLRQSIQMRGHFHEAVKSFYKPMKATRHVKKAFKSAICRTFGGVPMIKDPYALFSTEWLTDKFDFNVVIIIRHPAAFVGSLKRTQWGFDFRNLLDQPLLMQHHLADFAKPMQSMVDNGADLIDQASLLWLVLYSFVSKLEQRHPDWIFIKHEDLSRDPENAVRSLCHQLHVPFSNRIHKRIQSLTSTRNPSEVTDRQSQHVARNSVANITNWKKRLTEDEINRIRQTTEPVSSRYFGESDW